MAFAGVMSLAGLTVLLISDLAGSFYLWSLLGGGDTPRLCNFSVIARLIFALSVTMEMLAVSVLIMLAAHRRILRRGQMMRSDPAEAVNLSVFRIGTAIAFGSMLLFLHLGLYAIAFHADDVCSSKNMGEVVHHYVALVAAAMLYAGGSVFSIFFIMLALKRSLLSK
ncbi:MAG: hypothetical protein HQ465_08765 [Rhodospirillales bacterium]|nr:hypothetical protein [Rhodospirillales bacterium]